MRGQSHGCESVTKVDTDQFVGYDFYFGEVMSRTFFWNYMSGCTVGIGKSNNMSKY